ncbi:MAG: helix-turn-helix transcriptional regulator [Conexibacter sp.]|nr:helix-turn-helix transcriptional regulator [Conexibacter sp.]
MPHPAEHHSADEPLGRDEAEQIAEAMRAFGSASRLQLLWSLLAGERTVEQLVDAAGMEQSAVSHQLRLLRQQRLVAVRREGRHAYYRLHDHHLPELLTAMRHHQEHVNPPAAVALPKPAAKRKTTR